MCIRTICKKKEKKESRNGVIGHSPMWSVMHIEMKRYTGRQ